MKEVVQNEQTNAYEKGLPLSISNFNGPLDLLLHLVRQEKIEIKDIFVSEVTAQFISYISTMDIYDLDKATEYMEMAATLMEIKSRALLPKAERELLTEDPEKDLIKQLEEYRVFKEASEKLKEKENVDRLYREPSPDIDRPVYTIKDLSLDNLLDAFAKIMCRMELIKHEKENPKEIKKDAYTVAQKINYIRLKLIENSSLDFFELCDESGDIPEVVVTFMAILELAKRQIVSVLQDDICESITVMLKQEHKDDMFDYEEELG